MIPGAGYDLLGVGVSFELPSDPLASHLSDLLVHVPRTAGPVDHALRLIGSSEGRWALFDGDVLVRRRMTPGETILVAIWYLTQIASRTRHFAVLHAGSVSLEGSGLILPGRAGRGKSTLVAALVAHGFDYLSDELAALSLTTGGTFPFSRPIGLNPASVALFKGFLEDSDPRFEHEGRHQVAPTRLRSGSAAGPVLPKIVAFPRYVPGAACRVERISRAEALAAMCEQALNLADLGRPAFDAIASIASKLPSFRLVYDDLGEACAALEGLLIDGTLRTAGSERATRITSLGRSAGEDGSLDLAPMATELTGLRLGQGA